MLLLGAMVLGGCVAVLSTPVAGRALVVHTPTFPKTLDPKLTPRAEVHKVVAVAPLPPEVKSVAFPPEPRFVEQDDGSHLVKTNDYEVSLSAWDGVRYRPAQRDEKGFSSGKKGISADRELHLLLHKITLGENVLVEREAGDDDDMPLAEDNGTVSIWRESGIEERYHPRRDGLELTFLIEQKLSGSGDLSFITKMECKGLTPLPQRVGRNGGIVFVDSNGHVATRYGQVVIRDAEQRALVIQPELNAEARTIAFSVPGEWLKSASYPVLIDPLVGLDFAVSSDNAVGVGPPIITAGNNNFLVVWTDYRGGVNKPQLVGTIMSQSGIASVEFPVSATGGLPSNFLGQRLQVAFDGSNWLVVWEDDRQVGAGILGSIVSSNGSLLSGTDFLIAPTTGLVLGLPLVAYNGIDFVVSWQEVPPGATSGSLIYYTRVTSNGSVAATRFVPTEYTQPNQALLFLTAQKPSGDTLLLYAEGQDNPAQTRSVRIAGIDGSLRDAGGTTLFLESVAQNGFGRPIGVTFVNAEWHILSSYDQTVDSTIFLHRLSPSGSITPPSGKFAEMGVGPFSAMDQFAPAFAGAGEWLFVRSEKVSNTTYHLLGKRVTFAGIDRDPIPFQIDSATQGVLRNAMAAQVGNTFLVTWLDGRNSASQPADGRNVAAALVDVTFAGAQGTPLIPVITASTVNGDTPLSVLFDSVFSTGSFDSLVWDFGDGATSDLPQITHTYTTTGSYLAQLILTKGAYSVFDTVVINVGVGSGGTTTGTVVGSVVENAAGMETRLFIKTAAVSLNYDVFGKDQASVTGVADLGLLPNDFTAKNASITFGSYKIDFQLDAKGASKSDAAISPAYRFLVKPKTGQFAFDLALADLRAAMAALGARADTETRIDIPITLTIDAFTATSTVGLAYKADTAAGTGRYGFLKAGDEVSGSFGVSKFTAKQAGRTIKTHNYTITGQMTRPNGGTYRPALTGSFTFIIGNYSFAIPNGLLKTRKGMVFFKTAKAKKEDGGIFGNPFGNPFGLHRAALERKATVNQGVKKFILNLKSGKLELQFVRVPAELAGGSGLPIGGAPGNVVNVDLNLSLILDLDDGRFAAGRYIFISRKTSKGKTWKLR